MNFTMAAFPEHQKCTFEKKNSFDKSWRGFLSFQYAKQNILLRIGIPSGFLATPSESPKINKYFFLLYFYFYFFQYLPPSFKLETKQRRDNFVAMVLGGGRALSLKCGRPCLKVWQLKSSVVILDLGPFFDLGQGRLSRALETPQVFLDEVRNLHAIGLFSIVESLWNWLDQSSTVCLS